MANASGRTSDAAAGGAQRFAYTGRSAAGAVSGEVDGPDAATVAVLLRTRGITPLQIEAQAGAGSGPGLAALSLKRWLEPGVSVTDLLLFSRQLHTLLRAGVPILRALAGLQESATGERMKQTLAQVRRGLESGIELSMSLAQHGRVFDAFYVAMVRVGEMTGRLDEVFLRLFKHLEFELFMRQQVKSAVRYPAFVTLAMVAAIGVINIMVIPAFATVFQSFQAELPLATRILLATSRFTLQWGWLLALGAVAAAFALRAWHATAAGRMVWDRWQLRLPLAGKIVQKATLARFSRGFALALKSSVPIEQALAVVAQTVDNQHIARKVEGIRDAVQRGDSILRAAAASGVFTPVVLQMIAVGEETGAVEELMEEVADLYSNEVQYELKTLSQQLEPILIVFLGALVLVLALGVFLPMWDLGRVALKR
ncbi:type II secretion system F family protein [Ideonella sp. A 288]|uniref:type II secretion system F family protein n=1 Tax=Ideonella sp. A 288 TaxID=1962181 RepID=UPI000B4B973E|nr:type II secretion system F family protein [Ideonella sp. A 288]